MKRLLLLCLLGLAAMVATRCGVENDGSVSDSSGVHTDTVDDDGYVDLGLRSMTLWKATNEVNGNDAEHDFFTYDEAMAAFGNKLPTKEQFEELRRSCRWLWMGVGCYKVFGPSGKYILMPALGSRDCNGCIDYVGTYGFYWSSTPDGTTQAWYLNFYSNEVSMYNYSRCFANSVRLVKDVDDYK